MAHEQLSKTVRTRFLYISLTQKSAKWLRASKKSPSLVNLTASLAPRRVLRTNSKTKATQHLHNIVSKPSRSTLECERRVSNVLGNVTALSNALAELILAVQSPHLGRNKMPVRIPNLDLSNLGITILLAPKLSASISLSPLYPSPTNNLPVRYHERFARQYRYEPPPELPTSPFTCIVFHLSGLNDSSNTFGLYT